MAGYTSPYLKKPNEELEYNPEQLQELQKCSVDPIYFIKNYVKVQHPKRGMIPLILYDYQEDMIRCFQKNQFSICLASRQVGKTTTSAAYLLWYACFFFDKTVLVASNKNENAMEMVFRIQKMYEEMPHWLKPGVKDFNKHMIAFDNGSRILSQATTETTGRGLAISKLFLDELCFVRAGIQFEMWTSISPTLATGGECIIASTPNGDSDLFAELWRGAEAGTNGFVPVFVPWDAPPGRDEEFKRQQIGKIGERKFKQEYECQFISTSSNLFDSVALQRLSETAKKIPAAKLSITPKTNADEEQQQYDITTWGNVGRRKTYLIAVDPATGTDSDFSTIEVFEHPSLVQVAEFRDNTIQTPNLYKLIKAIILYFQNRGTNEVYYTFENNGIGEGLAALYNNDQNPSDASLLSEEGSMRIGFRTGKGKVGTCLKLKELVEKGKMTCNSVALYKEMKSYTKKGAGYAAQSGATDDLISACLLIIRMLESLASYDDDAFQQLYASELDASWMLTPGTPQEPRTEDLPPPMIF